MKKSLNILSVIADPPRELSEADKIAINIIGRQELVQEIQELESRAHHLGMTITGHALNNAKNACGWEMAGNVMRAGKAARGERK